MGFRIYRDQASDRQKTKIMEMIAKTRFKTTAHGKCGDILNDISKSEAAHLIRELKHELAEQEELRELLEAQGWKS